MGSAFPGVSTGVTGPEALNADQMRTALEDMSLATLVSMGALAALLIVFWRGLRRPLLEVILLLIALSFTFGLTTLFIGHLNILSVTFAPLLLGLGIDYGVHWFARYREMEQGGFASPRQAQGEMMERLGPGVLLAGLTAAFSFFPLVLTGFKGLVELGVICSLGLAVMVLMTLFLLPAMVLLFDRPERSRFLRRDFTPAQAVPEADPPACSGPPRLGHARLRRFPLGRGKSEIRPEHAAAPVPRGRIGHLGEKTSRRLGAFQHLSAKSSPGPWERSGKRRKRSQPFPRS